MLKSFSFFSSNLSLISSPRSAFPRAQGLRVNTPRERIPTAFVPKTGPLVEITPRDANRQKGIPNFRYATPPIHLLRKMVLQTFQAPRVLVGRIPRPGRDRARHPAPFWSADQPGRLQGTRSPTPVVSPGPDFPGVYTALLDHPSLPPSIKIPSGGI